MGGVVVEKGGESFLSLFLCLSLPFSFTDNCNNDDDIVLLRRLSRSIVGENGGYR